MSSMPDNGFDLAVKRAEQRLRDAERLYWQVKVFAVLAAVALGSLLAWALLR